MRPKILSILLMCACANVRAIPAGLLYDFDTPAAEVLPSEDDVSSKEIQLRVPVVFYGTTYRSIFVNSNGFLSFQTEIPQFINMEFPLDYPIIAPFYSNVDVSAAGTITYYETQDPALLHRATESVHDNFLEDDRFKAKSLFIVTWNGVGYFRRKADKLNTYQVVLITDGKDSYAEFLYPENGLQWIQGTGDESGLPDARAQVGFLSSDGKQHTLPGSATEQVRNLEKWTNMNLPGQFIFKISDIEIIQPDAYQYKDNQSFQPTCAEVPTACHSDGTCVDYTQGFCCRCNDHYFGNGKFCIANGLPLRVSGKVNGRINGERLENLDLQSYVVTADGRAYTAISKVPESIGEDIQTLQILGSVIGYLFAQPVRKAVNGFSKTGGQLNHTSKITFLNTSQVVHVTQKFTGLDVFDHLKVDIDIQGEIPTLPPDSRVIVDEYEEQYTQTGPGLLQMESERTYIVSAPEGRETVNVFKVEQNLKFATCPYENETDIGESWTLKVGRNFISYEAREQIIRFGINNKIIPFGDYDPCIEGRETCGENSACVVEGSSFSCVCVPGYQKIYINNIEPVCVDENECQTNHDCDGNAQCYNTAGSYQCTCNPGFEGDGKRCVPLSSCVNVTCNQDAVCVEVDGIATCRCHPGFRGDGYTCLPLTGHSCNINSNCSPYGMCSVNPNTDQYECSCLPGYQGDGYYCTPLPTTTPQALPISVTDIEVGNDARVLQTCNAGICYCPEGYIIDEGSEYCMIYSQREHDDCRSLHNCDVNASCAFNEVLQGYICTCNEGFEGDGFSCREERRSCREAEDCGSHATCVYDEDVGHSACTCSPGYSGDGYTCVISDAEPCNSNSDCTHTEACVYQNGRHECACREGYVRDSQHICVLMQDGSCGGGTCVENAECLFDQEVETFYCTCKPGFVGEGITECKEKPVGCDTLNNCGLHATCQYEPQALTYVCRCNPGFHGDGFNCAIERNCLVDRSMCAPDATCVTDGARNYICQCNPGFIGNGTVCKAIVRDEGNFLLLNQGWATHRIPLDADRRNPGKPVQIKTYQTAVGLDVDCMEGRFYWSDITTHAIRSATYSGSNNADFITDVGSPEGLAIDWVSRNIYWTDSFKRTIEVANIDSRRRRVLFRTGMVNPRGIAVHPQRGKIFWSDWDRNNPRIEWANADGSDRGVFWKGLTGKNSSLPNSLAIDYDSEQLCYSDAGTKKIECVHIDSRQIQTLATDCPYPFGIAITDRVVYWSDWATRKIERVDKYSLTRMPPLNIPAGGTGNKLFGLVAVPRGCPPLTNICQYSKCPEEYICLPDGKGSKNCLCAKRSDVNEEPHCAL